MIAFTGDRENITTTIEVSDQGDLQKESSPSSLQGSLKVVRKVGKQSNGYTVKLAKESEAAAIELRKDDGK